MFSIEKVYACTDSTVALHWISPHCWKTFIANRVTQIQGLVPVNLCLLIKIQLTLITDEQKTVVLHASAQDCPFSDLLRRYSSLKKVQRITACA
ncbi:hypothetical protein PR048_002375 [Dryococelus australis]|uniref:Uncharacterized protein n=1 Tax=Dryococelus australis TaxID=614101 RepID=A0ABQ9IK46_9NEOP|nr:hypothetical protein PR048_002375 [Dryococelus australis]